MMEAATQMYTSRTTKEISGTIDALMGEVM